jgi:hypothetical protein
VAESQATTETKLRFVISAYDTAQSMIKFSDEKATVVFILYGVLLMLLGTRADLVVKFIRDPSFSPLAIFVGAGFVVFLATAIYALIYALRTITPTFDPQVETGEHSKIYWCHDVLDKPIDQYFGTLSALSDSQILREMVSELYRAMAIERLKFERVGKAIRTAMISLVVWQVIIVATFFL